MGSIRHCDEMVQSGLVFVNGEKISTPTYFLQENDTVKVKNKTSTYSSKNHTEHFYFLFNKPIQVLSSHKDLKKRKLVFDFFKGK